ncbi:MAG: hypothetical protein JXN65_03160 [Clostridia bacterium]|nr:hypothetical protein [Clostridia bacterium]
MKMQEQKLKRFKVYKNISNVLFILTVVMGGLFMLAALFTATVLSAAGYDIVDVAQKILAEVQPEVLPMIPEGLSIPYGVIFTGIISAGLSISLTAYIFKSVSLMFGRIVEQGTPFASNMVKGLKHMGIAFFIYTGLIFVLSILAGTVINHPEWMTFNVNISWSSIMFGLLLFSLGEIFEFGLSLQVDSESIV